MVLRLVICVFLGGLFGECARRLSILLIAKRTKEELQAKLLGTISAPMSGFVNVAAGNIRGLINVIRVKAKAE